MWDHLGPKGRLYALPGSPPARDAPGAGTHRGAEGRSGLPSPAVTSPEQPPSVRPVEYKGEPLDAQRGPGLGCFRFQVGLLVVLIVLTPLSVYWDWPPMVSASCCSR